LSPSLAEQFPNIFGPDGCVTSLATPAISDIPEADLASFRSAVGEDLYIRLQNGEIGFSTAELQRIVKASQGLQDVVTTCPAPEVRSGATPSPVLRRGQSLLGYSGAYERDVIAGRQPSPLGAVGGPGIQVLGAGSDAVLSVDTAVLGGKLDVVGLVAQGSGSTVPSMSVSYLDESGVEHQATAQSLVPALRPGEPAPIVVELGKAGTGVSQLSVVVASVNGATVSRELQIFSRPVKAERGSVTFDEIAVDVRNRAQYPIANPVVVVAILDTNGAITEIHVAPLANAVPIGPDRIRGVHLKLDNTIDSSTQVEIWAYGEF